MSPGVDLSLALLAAASIVAMPASRFGEAAAVLPRTSTTASIQVAAPSQRADRPSNPGASRRPAIDIFAPRSWAPPPPPPAPPIRAAVERAPPPSAPPLPYTYLGQLRERGRTIVFLSRDDVPIAAAAGEVLEGTYRVEHVGDTSVEFVYLPLHERQVLGIGGMQP